MATHKLRALGASILMIFSLALLAYILVRGQYDELLQFYQAQGDRAYVFAFVDIFLYRLFSTEFMVIAFLAILLLTLLLVKRWEDGFLAGLLVGVVVSLLSLYLLNRYEPAVLSAGGMAIVWEKLYHGVTGGLALGIFGVLGGGVRQKLATRHYRIEIASLRSERKVYRCPRCGTPLESNPRICAVCGKRLRARPEP